MEFRRCRRIFFVMMITLFIFNLYVLRLAQIQLLRGRTYSRMAVEQKTEKLVLDMNRGGIYDRRGLCLLDTHSYRGLVLLPGLVRSGEEKASTWHPWSPEVEKILAEKGNARPTLLTAEESHRLLQGESLPEGLVQAEITMRYGPGSLAPHVVGYTNSSGRGLLGVEGVFNRELAPERPSSLVALVDGRRRLIKGLGYRFWEDSRAFTPYNLHLTLDREIQELVEKVMARNLIKGAVVVMDPWTGDLLAMASLPAFDQNDIGSLFLNTEESLNLQEGLPFLNRAIRSYFPGSTFKMVLAAAYLESGGKPEGFTFNCPGYIQVGGRRIGCSGTHGQVNLAQALAHSCNAAFIHLGWELGGKALQEQAQALGFGEKTGLPLQGERPGHLPGAGMDRGILALASIGQGDVDVTPFQLARAYSAVANGGFLPTPRLVDRLTAQNGITVKKYPTHRSTRILSAGTVEVLKEMLHQVTVTGTGRPGAPVRFEAAAKTGTAETGRSVDGKPQLYRWMAGFAPLATPRFTVVVFVEEATRSNAHTTIFKEILDGVRLE